MLLWLKCSHCARSSLALGIWSFAKAYPLLFPSHLLSNQYLSIFCLYYVKSNVFSWSSCLVLGWSFSSSSLLEIQCLTNFLACLLCSEADEVFKICGVMGSPTWESWAEGLHLARAINYQFPQVSLQVLPAWSVLFPLSRYNLTQLFCDVVSWCEFIQNDTVCQCGCNQSH